MAWDAGAITGSLDFNVGQYVANVDQSIGKAINLGAELASLDGAAHHAGAAMAAAAAPVTHLGHSLQEAGEHAEGFGHSMAEMVGLSEVFRVAAQSIFELPLELIKKSFELAEEAAKKFFETIAEVGNEAAATMREALKAGVSVEFFSQMEEAGKRVGVSNDVLGMSFKLMQKNAVDAVSGASAEAKQGFASIGISSEFLASHLNDTQGIFEAVRQKMALIPDSAERVRVAMQIMGRGGSDIIPLFAQSNKQMQESIDLATRLGAVDGESAGTSSAGWVKASAAFDDLWKGLSKVVAEPFLKYLTENWQDVRRAIIQFADAAVEVIPPAMRMVYNVMYPVLSLIQEFVDESATLAAILDALGIHNNAAEHLLKLSTTIGSLQSALPQIIIDSDKAREEWRAHEGVRTDGQGPTEQHNHIAIYNHTFDPDGGHQVKAVVTDALQEMNRKNNQKAADKARHEMSRNNTSARVGGSGRLFPSQL